MSAARVCSLLGPLESAADIAEALAALAAPDATAVQLDVFDADHLPVTLIEAIAAALDRGVHVQVRAYRPLLVHALLRLGLPVLAVPAQPPRAQLARCRAVALGGSANSLDKLLTLIEILPKSEASLFIVQHIREDLPNLLDRLLKVRTEYAVEMPQHLTHVAPGTIYIAPPGQHMKVAHGRVYLTRDRKVQYARPSIDVLFESIAGEYREEALAVLLCGYGEDGVAGCAAVRAAGGLVLIEDGRECGGAGVLPDRARDAGVYDHRLGIHGLASLVAAAVAPRQKTVSGALLDAFLAALLEQSGYDLRHHERASLERRLNHHLSQCGANDFFDYQRRVLANPLESQRLITELSINVSEFFRHPEQFRVLRERVLPWLASFPLLKIWSAGCATGEEAYSLAILLDELGLLDKSRLFATDINAYALEIARAGLYPRAIWPHSEANFRAAGGNTLKPHLQDRSRYLSIASRLAERVLFHRHVLGQDGAFNEFELIVCRNVMIYFDRELQRRVFTLFSRSLHREGLLMLGPRDGLDALARECGFRPHPAGAHLYCLEPPAL